MKVVTVRSLHLSRNDKILIVREDIVSLTVLPGTFHRKVRCYHECVRHYVTGCLDSVR